MKSFWKLFLFAWLAVALVGCSLGMGNPAQVQTEAPTMAATLAPRADVTVVPYCRTDGSSLTASKWC